MAPCFFVDDHKALLTGLGSDGIALAEAYGDVAAYDVLRDEGSDSIVYEYYSIVVFVLGESCYAVAQGQKTGAASIDARSELSDACVFCHLCHTVLTSERSHDVYVADKLVLLKGTHGVLEDSLTVYHDVLLGDTHVHATPFASCEYECYAVWHETLLQMFLQMFSWRRIMYTLRTSNTVTSTMG